jgi:hypothetical protein
MTKNKSWHIDRSEGTKIKDGDDNTVLWTAHTHLHGRRTDAEVMKIARLAAAAPDLLEALRQCEEYFDARADADLDQDGYVPNEEMQMLVEIRAAIAKAVST